MFKFVSKGDSHENESALFYNGQKILSLYTMVYSDGEVVVQVEDGGNHLQAEWQDWIEDIEVSD